ncbi:MAG TPA: endonuclease III, partial [Alphaproteobacteria bacterium]|nr:endonuclease III [Alphaproteobacteria bacterium]
ALSKTLRDAYGGEIPRTREGLEKLPGVGRKTANVVMNVVYGEPTMAVDTHIFRMGNRIGLAPGKTPREVEDGLMRVIPKKYMQHAHHWLILHGRYICTARTPKCRECPIMQWCEYPDKNL